jgi:hypothetical protein
MWRKYNINVLTASAVDTFHIPMFRHYYNYTDAYNNIVLNVKL